MLDFWSFYLGLR